MASVRYLGIVVVVAGSLLLGTKNSQSYRDSVSRSQQVLTESSCCVSSVISPARGRLYLPGGTAGRLAEGW